MTPLMLLTAIAAVSWQFVGMVVCMLVLLRPQSPIPPT